MSKKRKRLYGGWFPYFSDYNHNLANDQSDDNDDDADGSFDGDFDGGFDGDGFAMEAFGVDYKKQIIENCKTLIFAEQQMAVALANLERKYFIEVPDKRIVEMSISITKNFLNKVINDEISPKLLPALNAEFSKRIEELDETKADFAQLELDIKKENEGVVLESFNPGDGLKDIIKPFTKIIKTINKTLNYNDEYIKNLSPDVAREVEDIMNKREMFSMWENKALGKLANMLEEYEISDEMFDQIDNEKETQAFDKARDSYRNSIKACAEKMSDVIIDRYKLDAIETYLEDNFTDKEGNQLFDYDINLDDTGDYEISYTEFNKKNPSYKPGAEEAVMEALYVNHWLTPAKESEFKKMRPDVQRKFDNDEDVDPKFLKKIKTIENEEEILDDMDEELEKEETDFAVDKKVKNSLLKDLDEPVEEKVKDDMEYLYKDAKEQLEADDEDEESLKEALNKLLTKVR